MQILHFFPKEKFTKGFIDFVNKNYEHGEHTFIVYGTSYKMDCTEENVVCVDSLHTNYFKINKLVKTADRIVVHSGFNTCLLVYLFIRKKIAKKTVMTLFGGELNLFTKENRGIITKLKRIIVSKLYQNLYGIGFMIDEDYEVLKEKVNSINQKYIALYINLKEQQVIESLIEKKMANDVKRILVGNSATKSNCHQEAFEALRKYKDENMMIYCPLSYGDDEYADYIQNLGTEIFGDKFIAIRNYMKLEEYLEFLNTIDIAVFNNDRQQALGNINDLLCMGTKVYLRNGTPMWEHYEKSNMIVHDIEEIQNVDFIGFAEHDIKEKNTNYNEIKAFRDEDSMKEKWSLIFYQ